MSDKRTNGVGKLGNMSNVSGELNRPKGYFLAATERASCGRPAFGCRTPSLFSLPLFRCPRTVRTPALCPRLIAASIARAWVQFTHAFCARSSSSAPRPSSSAPRSAVLTGSLFRSAYLADREACERYGRLDDHAGPTPLECASPAVSPGGLSAELEDDL